MTDEEHAAFEAAQHKGEKAILRILASMPAGDCAIKSELAMALADGIRDCAGLITNPTTSGFIFGASGQIALALLSLASNQPTFHNH